MLRLLTNLVAPRQPGELTFKEPLTKLESYFKPKPVKIAERFQFFNETSSQGGPCQSTWRNCEDWLLRASSGHFLTKPLRQTGLRSEGGGYAAPATGRTEFGPEKGM